MRDMLVFLLFIGVLPACFLRPWFGLLAFTWLAYNRTHDLAWGFAKALPISQLIAVFTLLGWILWEFAPLNMKDRRMKAMVMLLAMIGLSILCNTLRLDAQLDRYTDLVKIILIALLTATFVTNRDRLRQILLCITFALAFYGVKNGLWFLLGRETLTGPGGMLSDNNDFALAMAMTMPLLYYLSKTVDEAKYAWLVKVGMLGAFALTAIAVVATGSRGGFLALATVLSAIVLKSRIKVVAVAVGVAVAIVGFLTLPTEYKERLSTISFSIEEMDSSAQGRILSWLVAANMIRQEPIFGIGYENMVYDYHRYLDADFIPSGLSIEDARKDGRVAHNSYLQIWAESGSIAYLLYIFMVMSTVFLLRRLARQSRGGRQDWVVPYCKALEVALWGFISGAIFLNRAHFDLVYQIVAIAAAIPIVLLTDRSNWDDHKHIRPAVANEIQVGHQDPFERGGHA